MGECVLVTGGAGYIGSHTCLELLQAGFEVVVVDNLVNSKLEVLRRVEQITGKTLTFVKADIAERERIKALLVTHACCAVMHFAGLKAVGESCAQPLRYYHNNVAGTIALCQAMLEAGVKRMVFSSSATVYGDPEQLPIREDFPLKPANPYGRTKLFIEEILRDLAAAEGFSATLLRYFNPVGAHPSGLIGEDPKGIPNNLVPYLTQVAVGKLKELKVFGGDWPTRDGTGVRDYIHVVDLAKAHLKALEKQLASPPGVFTYNLGTGKGYSVLEVVKAFEQACGKRIPYRIVGRRAGDVAEVYADPSLAAAELGWRAEKGIEEMAQDAWRWQSLNPDGY
jgi:UDP-glucose 4-epimerase